jgi:hypothetical protein
LFDGVREFDSVGDAVGGVPKGSAVKRNGTEAVPYNGSPCFEFPGKTEKLVNLPWPSSV